MEERQPGVFSKNLLHFFCEGIFPERPEINEFENRLAKFGMMVKRIAVAFLVTFSLYLYSKIPGDIV